MEDICYLVVQIPHYNRYAVVCLADSFLVVQTVPGVVVVVGLEDIHDNLVVLHAEAERLVHSDGNCSDRVPLAVDRVALKVWSYIQDCDSPVVHQMMEVLDFLQERKDFHWKASLTQLVVHLVVHLFLAYLEEDPNGDFALPDLNCFPCQVARLGLVTDPAGLVHGNHLEAVPVVVHGQEAVIDFANSDLSPQPTPNKRDSDAASIDTVRFLNAFQHSDNPI